MSYKAEVIADRTGTWCGNGLVFADAAEAKAYALDLACRWTLVTDVRVVESTEPVNCRFDTNTGRRIHLD